MHRVNPKGLAVCQHFLGMNPEELCSDCDGKDCSYLTNSPCFRTKLAAAKHRVEFVLPYGFAVFRPTCASCAHLIKNKGAYLCGLSVDVGVYEEVKLTNICESWNYDV